MSRVPYTSSDLLEIAKRLRAWERLLVGPNGYTDRSNLVSRIEVHRPEEPGEIIGHFVLEDECVGFLPLEDQS